LDGTQTQKDRIIGGLVAARQKVMEAVALLSPAQQDEVFLGEWSAKDLLAHLIGWDYTNLEAVGEIRAGRRPGFWQYHDRDWQSYNARLVAEHRREDWGELVAAVEGSHRALIDYLQSVPADDYVKRKKIGTLLRAEAKDEQEHARQVERFQTGGG
jgi:hypothetical protein